MNLAELLARTAAARPDANAVVGDEGALTYAELDELSARIRTGLIRAGVGPGDRVCLLLPKSPLAIAAILGVLRAGAVYTPLDTDGPATRVAKIVARCDTPWIVCEPERAELAGRIRDIVARPSVLLWLPDAPSPDSLPPEAEGPWELALADPDGAEDRLAGPEETAYIFFTSGSTGEPKGVVITHANVTSFLAWAVPYFALGPDDRMSAHPPLHFDLSVFDLFGAIAAGAELHLVPQQLNLLPHRMAEFIGARRLTHWFSVPGVLTLLARYDLVDPARMRTLRRVLWCGEVLPTPTLIAWMKALPSVRFTNLYGPTEATIASSYHTFDGPPARPTDRIPIGRACAGEELVVLDEGGRPLPSGQVGDLYIGGTGLSPGYWRDPTTTAAAFVADPREGRTGRLYRTGDLASVRPNGLVDFHGRSDGQIKSRGYRIELGEIEAALSALGFLREATVVATRTSGFEGSAICCAFVANTSPAPTPAAIKEALRDALPTYMVPRHWREVDALPRNANGKVDRGRVTGLFERPEDDS